MSNTSKDPQVKPSEMWKHLRPFLKRKFHKRVRRLMRIALKRREDT